LLESLSPDALQSQRELSVSLRKRQ
jgi:hypothetical protein